VRCEHPDTGRVYAISHAVNEPCDLAIARKYAPECFTAEVAP